MRMTAWSVVALLISAPATPAHAGNPAQTSLVAAERAFAALSVKQGIRESFLAYLAPDAVVFRPTATNGPRAMRAHEASKTPILNWEPAYAEVSAAGDLGVTTGPWEMRATTLAPPAAFGHFVTVWKRTPGGKWRVAVDLGTQHPRVDPAVGNGKLELDPTGARAPAGATADLRALDRDLARAMRSQGIAGAYASRAADDVRYNRDDLPPLVGSAAVGAHLKLVPGYIEYRPEGRRVAASGDLGCTYGRAEEFASPGTAPDSSVFLHVWRRNADGVWKLSLEVLNPLPKPGKQ